LQTHFEIPNVEPLQSKIISNINIKLCQFKSTLMTKYVFGSYEGKNPCLKYANNDKETWRLFVQSRESKVWLVSEVT